MQVKAPSGAEYILTAGHCESLASNGTILASIKGKRPIPRRIIEVDANHDLMLLEALPAVPYVEVAKKQPGWETVVTVISHGAGLNRYTATGELVEEKTVDVLDFIIDSPDKAKACQKPKYKTVKINLWFFEVEACVLHLNYTVTPMPLVVPGSSGAAALYNNRLVGVVSAGGQGFAFLVPLSAIHAFLANY